MNEDRIVHALTRSGAEIVRYDRAGKWYIEHPRGTMLPARQVSVSEAARIAAPGIVNFNLPGGLVFERKVRALRFKEAADVRA